MAEDGRPSTRSTTRMSSRGVRTTATRLCQEAIESAYYRCYVLGRKRVHIMAYDPKQPFHLRYVQNPPPMDPAFERKIRRDCIALCEGLGYDMNTVEFAVRGGIPYAIDFMNCAPDADLNSVGRELDWWSRHGRGA